MPDPAFTLGVEEEYQVIDPATRQLASQSGKLIQTNQQNPQTATLIHEMHRCQVEIATDVCYTLSEVRAQLVRARQAANQAAQSHGLAIAAAGTHPFSRWQQQHLTPKDRYRSLNTDLQQLVRELIIFGCHVHIGIADRDAAIGVMNRARLWLPSLLALTASSPFWLGKDTGYHSYRMVLWSRLPTAGPPPIFTDYRDHQQFVQRLIDTEIIDDPTKIYWDIRLSDRFPTIEFRMADVCTTVDETVMFAGLVRALTQTCYQAFLDCRPYPEIRTELLKAAMWQAARYGTQGHLIDFSQLRPIPAADSIQALLQTLQPALERNGDWEVVRQQVDQVLTQGNGALRQRQVFAQQGSYPAVVDQIVEQTRQV
ncbi:carboxylate-amine ligase [Lyngbya confervoides]|uniref:Putative glutamate--cysteine ligase 2 n=1 Tax=Lyngbya confervoides BDU141951 TaxID=1574623 RepID=A0ABD4T8M1_9CYAN|nr:carboxylate-amine ligase [Lyngbya confervoides]MCM1984625.1 carboxylate-amine ligase [Lyngbya confervoides BDU141951]